MTHVDTEQAWIELLASLGVLLDDLANGQSFSLMARARRHFVSATRLDSGWLRLESVSNGHLGVADRLDIEALDLLEHLGWQPPTHFVDQVEVHAPGSTNHFADFEPGWQGAEVAAVMVRTLRGVHEIRRPCELECHADTTLDRRSVAHVGRLVAGHLRAEVEPDTDDLLTEIIDGLNSVTRVFSVVSVAKTDRVLRIAAGDGSTIVFYDRANNLVRASMPIISGYPPSSDALLALLECGRPMRCGRLELRADVVYALVDLPALPSVGQLLASYLASFEASLPNLRELLEPYTKIGIPPLSGG